MEQEGKEGDSVRTAKAKAKATKDVTDDPNMVYSCEACDMTFASVQEHLAEYHENEEVLLETEESESANRRKNTEEGTVDPDTQRMVSDEENEMSNPPIPITVKYIMEFGEARELDKEEAARLEKASIEILEIHSCSNCHLQFPNLTHFSKHKCSIAKMVVSKVKTKAKKGVDETVEDPKGNLEKPNGVAMEKPKVIEKHRFQCTFCLVDYGTITELKDHMKSHLVFHSSGFVKKTVVSMSLISCNICYAKFPTVRQLKFHEENIHGGEQIDPLADAGDEHLKDHTLRTTLETFTCEICNKLYDKQYEEAHMKSHYDLNNLCLICNKTFEPKESLDLHVKAHSKAIKMVCSYCKKAFNTYELLKTHVDTQCQSRKFECSFCGRRFAKATETAIHERIHTGEKPHVCDICGRSFRIRYCLTLHMRTHTGNRPYACTFAGCNKRFKSLSMFSNHEKTHSDVRNYKCPFCPKAFKTVVQLAGHKNSHTKPFSCTECNRPFSSLYAVRAHMETHKRNNNLKFECWICGANYARSFALRDHMNETHVQESNTEGTQNQQVLVELEAGTEEIEEQSENVVEEIVSISGQTDVEEQGDYHIIEEGSDMCDVQIISTEDSEQVVTQMEKNDALMSVDATVKLER